MTFAEILDIEDANTDRIYLYRAGKFLKVYEHSAFLFHRYIADFKLSRRFIKTVNRYVISLGFPEANLKKWLYAYPVQELDEKRLVCDIEKSVDEVEYQEWTELARVQANPGDRYTVHTSVIEHQPVYKTAYDLHLHVISLSKNIAKNMWDPHALRAKRLSYDIAYGLRTFYEAPDRDARVDEVQEKCRELAFVLQILCDQRQISVNSFALDSERIVSVSIQLEGLRRTAKA